MNDAKQKGSICRNYTVILLITGSYSSKIDKNFIAVKINDIFDICTVNVHSCLARAINKTIEIMNNDVRGSNKACSLS